MDRKETEIRAGERPDQAGEGGRGARVDTVEPAVSRFESLLRQGNELYASGQYERAVHVWTRVLFLERGNVEARNGIDRAKRAIAERQRRLDAAVADAHRRFDAGEVDEAAAIVGSVLSDDPRHVEACGLETRIAASARRAEPPPAAEEAVSETPVAPASRGVLLRVSRPRAPRPARRRRPSRFKMALFVAGVLLAFGAAAVVLRANWEHLVSGEALASPGGIGLATGAEVATVVPSLSELAFYNGARLFDKGRYREALRELSRVERDSSVAGEARSLILRIEERLLRGAAGSASDSAAVTGASQTEAGEGAIP